MLEKIKKSFETASFRNGSYSVGFIVLVICIVVAVNLIAGQLPENIRNIDISDNRIYEITEASRKMLGKLEDEITFTVYAEKDSADDRIKSFLKKIYSFIRQDSCGMGGSGAASGRTDRKGGQQ